MKLISPHFAFGLAVLAFAATLHGSAQTCTSAISFPKTGEKVREQEDVKGTASIPADTYLWVLARRDDQPKTFFWPQGSVKASDMQGEPPTWDVSITFGVDRDKGKRFRVVVIIVDAATHARLTRWMEEAPAKNYAPWQGLPTTVKGCTLTDVVVEKSAE
jgi:hypothetical protein